MPCPPGQALSYCMPCIARSCNIPCYASPDHTLYHIMPARPYRMPCHAHQAIPYTMLCPPGYTIYHCQAIPYTMPCSPGHIVSHAMPTRPYHIPCHASPDHKLYTMPWLPDHTIYLTLSARSYHIPCHAMANHYFGKSCHFSKRVNSLVTICTTACK